MKSLSAIQMSKSVGFSFFSVSLHKGKKKKGKRKNAGVLKSVLLYVFLYLQL